MRERSINTEHRRTAGSEKHARQQAPAYNVTRFSSTANVASSKRYIKRVSGQVPVAAEDTTSALPEVGYDHNVSLVVSRAGFQPCFPLPHVVRRSQVCVSVTASDLQTTELVDQKEVNNAG